MSEGNVETVERAIRALDAKGPREVFAQGLAAPDAEWHPLAELETATYVGAEGFAKFMETWTEGFAEWSIRLVNARAAGDRVLGFVRQEATGSVSGVDVAMDFWMVSTLESGRIIEVRNYLDRAEALQAAGLSE